MSTQTTTCGPWCTPHIPLSLEAVPGQTPPRWHAHLDDGPTGEPVVVSWTDCGTGQTVTLDEARRQRDLLSALLAAAEAMPS